MNGYQRTFLVLVSWVGIFGGIYCASWLDDNKIPPNIVVGLAISATCFVVMVFALLGLVSKRKPRNP